MFCIFVIVGLPPITFVIFGIWVAVVVGFYFVYGIKHSRLEQLPGQGVEAETRGGP